jgi:hypothetical protein
VDRTGPSITLVLLEGLSGECTPGGLLADHLADGIVGPEDSAGGLGGGAKACFAIAECVDGFDLADDISMSAEPMEDATKRIFKRSDASSEAAEDSVGPAQGEDHVKGFTGGDRLLPPGDDLGEKSGIVYRLPAPALHLLEGGAGVFEPALVVPEYPAAWIGNPGEVGKGFRKDAEGQVASGGGGRG